jgi:hypothetical protein
MNYAAVTVSDAHDSQDGQAGTTYLRVGVDRPYPNVVGQGGWKSHRWFGPVQTQHDSLGLLVMMRADFEMSSQHLVLVDRSPAIHKGADPEALSWESIWET